MWECKGIRIANKILKKKKVGRIILSDFKIYYIAAGIKPENISGGIDTLISGTEDKT